MAIPSASWACLFKITSELESLDQYSSIFIGKVVSVKLRKDSWLAASDLTMAHDMTVEITETLAGTADGTVYFGHEAGCGIPVPRPGDVGIFFTGGPDDLLSVYEFESHSYRRALRELRSR